MSKLFIIVVFLTKLLMLTQAKNEEYCKKYSGKDDDFIDCCITLFPAMDDDEKSEQVKYDLCDNFNNKCEEHTCIMETDNLLQADGKLNKTAIIANAMSDKHESVWQAVIERIYAKCSRIAEGSACVAMDFTNCFEPTTFLECPKTEWNDTPNCNEAKRFVQNCILKQ